MISVPIEAPPAQIADTLGYAFKALGDANRLRLFALIAAREMTCVGDLVTVLDLPQSTVSRHLATLRDAKLVQAHRDGTWVHYSVSTAPESKGIVRSIVQLVTATETFVDDASRAASLAAAGGCCPRHTGDEE